MRGRHQQHDERRLYPAFVFEPSIEVDALIRRVWRDHRVVDAQLDQHPSTHGLRIVGRRRNEKLALELGASNRAD